MNSTTKNCYSLPAPSFSPPVHTTLLVFAKSGTFSPQQENLSGYLVGEWNGPVKQVLDREEALLALAFQRAHGFRTCGTAVPRGTSLLSLQAQPQHTTTSVSRPSHDLLHPRDKNLASLQATRGPENGFLEVFGGGGAFLFPSQPCKEKELSAGLTSGCVGVQTAQRPFLLSALQHPDSPLPEAFHRLLGLLPSILP